MQTFDASFVIPLRAKTGEVRAYALVDHCDYVRLSAYGWLLNSNGYAVRYEGHWKERKRHRLMHREVLKEASGLPPTDRAEGDHVNRNRLDNRRSNLRWVNRSQQLQNKGSYAGSTSTYRGVHWDTSKQRWVAQIQSGGRSLWRRHFRDEHAAGAAVTSARKELFPFSHEAASA